MNINAFIKVFAVLAVSIFSICAQAQDNVVMNITGLRSGKGQIIIQVFTSQQNFKAEQPVAIYKYPKKAVVNGTLTVKCTLKPGTYGLALLDDENNSSKMEYNMIGMPKEGFGFSDYYHTGMTRPVFDDFRIDIPGGAKQTKMKVRYL